MNAKQTIPQATSTTNFDISIQLDAPDHLASSRLCLEFVNTNEWHAAEFPVETLFTYADLVDWAAKIGIRSAQSTQELKEQATKHPILATQIYDWAIELREAMYHIFVALINHQLPAPSDLAILNEALPHAYTQPLLSTVTTGNSTGQGDTTFGIQWRCDENGLDGILWPILRSAIRLLTEGEHSRIGQCADDRGCGYLFYDTSRNRSRRWCTMSSCGNRAKSQRHYARRKTTPSDT